MITREDMSQRYIKGHGIEIGAFHSPFPVHFNKCTMDYVDTKTKAELKEIFPEINQEVQNVIDANIIDDGELLGKVEDQKYDFLISSHQLEHCISPLTALQNQLRVVKPGGYLFYAIPNMYKTFDKERPITSWRTFFEYYNFDFRGKFSNPVAPQWEKKWEDMVLSLYNSYFTYVDKIQDLEERIKIGRMRMEKKLDIHFHTFTPTTTYEFFYKTIHELKFPFHMELFLNSGHEIFILIQKDQK